MIAIESAGLALADLARYKEPTRRSFPPDQQGWFQSSNRENRVGHSIFLNLDFVYLPLKIATPAAGLLTWHKDAAVQGTGSFSSFSLSFSLLLFLFLPLLPSLLPLLALLCLLSLIFYLGLTHDLSQECRQVSPFGTPRRRTISIGIPKDWTLLDGNRLYASSLRDSSRIHHCPRPNKLKQHRASEQARAASRGSEAPSASAIAVYQSFFSVQFDKASFSKIIAEP